MKIQFQAGFLITASLVLASASQMVVHAGGATRNVIQIADRVLTVTGTIEQVWEDGFRLTSSDRTYTVDSWDVCGDATAQHLTTGDRVTVTGDLEGGELDASTIHKNDGSPSGVAVCR